ncbi:hypothetical protein [Methylobacterium sp. SD21]
MRFPVITIAGRPWAVRYGIAVIANGHAIAFRNVHYLTLGG